MSLMSHKHVYRHIFLRRNKSHVCSVQSIVTNTQERGGRAGRKGGGSVFVTIFRYNNVRTLPTHNERTEI